MKPDQIGDRLLQAIEQNSQLFASLSDELKAQVKTLIDAQVESLGLVTRDEFDALRKSVDRAIEKANQLEADLSD